MLKSGNIWPGFCISLAQNCCHPSKLDNRSDNYEIQSLLGNGSSEGDSLIGQYRFNAKVHNQEFIGRYGFQNGIHEYENRVSFWQRQI